MRTAEKGSPVNSTDSRERTPETLHSPDSTHVAPSVPHIQNGRHVTLGAPSHIEHPEINTAHPRDQALYLYKKTTKHSSSPKALQKGLNHALCPPSSAAYVYSLFVSE